MSTGTMTLQRASVQHGGLAFDTDGGLPRALQDGCFLLALPDGFDPGPGITLCREFYRAPDDGPEATRPYRGFRALEGVYFDREHFQTEHVLIDGPGRLRHFSPELMAMTERMSELTLLVLRCAMAELGIAPALWSEITGGAVEGRGTHWFAANHYRSERAQLGCAPHKDTGFVTVLYNEEPGLEASVDGAWVPVDPVPGHFVVNFGGAFELLTAELARPVRAILHQVRRCTPAPGAADRFSFAAFANPPATGDLYQVRPDGTAAAVRSSADFLREFNAQTWSDRHTDFGIARSVGAGRGEPS
ncbi:2OG-Fe(II) oxygenase family protein [Streptomyces sp. DH24]|uniref:2OG-Fe(II) oxygenase family protein n=1 Tax=Streptomyces sp. DH24 TaxID=3040123 RepID=UPI002441D055|nr:2OG-Fe(II) oxygenase family protein [Streptomyces sp. DH24]MDG9719748.1 2OG-Fe(II) oxygenase family protein [Streptomyces sp. DH24]